MSKYQWHVVVVLIIVTSQYDHEPTLLRSRKLNIKIVLHLLHINLDVTLFETQYNMSNLI